LRLPQVSAQPHSSHCMPCHVHRQCPCQPRGVGSACPQLLPIEPIALDRHCADALAHLVSSPLIAGVVDAAIDTREAGLLAQILPRACRLPPGDMAPSTRRAVSQKLRAAFQRRIRFCSLFSTRSTGDANPPQFRFAPISRCCLRRGRARQTSPRHAALNGRAGRPGRRARREAGHRYDLPLRSCVRSRSGAELCFYWWSTTTRCSSVKR